LKNNELNDISVEMVSLTEVNLAEAPESCK